MTIPPEYRSAGFVRLINEIYHDHEAAVYDTRHPEILRWERDRWKRLLRFTRQRGLSASPHVLDVGCGTGFVSMQVARFLPESTLVCLDVSAEMLALAEERLTPRFGKERVRYIQGTLESDTLSAATFDLVVMNSVLHHLPDPHRALETIHRLLMPGGFVVISHEPNPRFHETRFPANVAGILYRIRKQAEFWLDPSRYRRRFARLTGRAPAGAAPTGLTEATVRTLRERGIITPGRDFPREWVTALVDRQIPTVATKEDTQPLDMRRIVGDLQEPFKIEKLECYNWLADESQRSALHLMLNGIVSRVCPSRGAHQFCVLKKF